MNSKKDHTNPVVDQDSKPFQYDLGILLVHGIGDQKRGETLKQVGDTLCSWMIRWFTKDQHRKRSITGPPLATSNVHIRRTVWTQSGVGQEEPAHLELAVNIHGNGKQTEQVWLLAESMWASSINPPTYFDFIKWAYFIVPWVTSTSFVQLLRRGKLLATLGFIVSPIITFFLFIFMTLLGILSIVPNFRDFVTGLQRLVSGILGDIFLYAESTTSRSSILTQVLNDMTWLRTQRCKKIIVLAHSQGSAIAYDLLSKLVSRGMRSLITYGSAIFKINQFDSLTPGAMAKIGYLPLLGFLILAFSMWLWPAEIALIIILSLAHAHIINVTFNNLIKLSSTALPLKKWTLAINTFFSLAFTAYLYLLVTQNFPNLVLNYLACLCYVYSFYIFKMSDPFEILTQKLYTGGGYTWTDFYASADLVPNGPILEGEEGFIEVYNRESWLFDHVTYWKAPDDFVWRIIRLLFHQAGLGEHSMRPDADLKFCTDYVHSRKRRVVSLKRCRYFLGFISAVCFWFIAKKAPQEQFSFLYNIGAKIKPYLEYLPQNGLSEVTLGVIVFLLVVSCLYLIIFLYWNLWDKFTQIQFFGKKPLSLLHERLFRFSLWGIVIGSIFFLGNVFYEVWSQSLMYLIRMILN